MTDQIVRKQRVDAFKVEEQILANLGPLAQLAGVWEGVKGKDRAPSDDRGVEQNLYFERMQFEPLGRVDNHEQHLWGLRYRTMVWRLNEEDAYHEETGYWLWDPASQQVMRCFLIPRGVSVIAGGVVDAKAKQFELNALLGSPTFGICSNPFLDREFKTVSYQLKMEIGNDGKLTYEEDTVLKIKNQDELFHHTDENTLVRVKDWKYFFT